MTTHSSILAWKIPWTDLFTGFSRQDYWSELPNPSPLYLRNPGIKPGSPALQADFLLTALPGKARQQGYDLANLS